MSLALIRFFVNEFIEQMFDYWKTENYGKLSVKLKKIINGDNPKHCAGECKKLFLNKKFISYKILEVEEKAAALSRVLIAIKFKKDEEKFNNTGSNI